MFPMPKCRARELVVESHWSGNGNRINGWIAQELLGNAADANTPEAGTYHLQPALIRVAGEHGFHLRSLKEVADEVGSPVAAAQDSHNHRHSAQLLRPRSM
jgi:hypothetical protein